VDQLQHELVFTLLFEQPTVHLLSPPFLVCNISSPPHAFICAAAPWPFKPLACNSAAPQAGSICQNIAYVPHKSLLPTATEESLLSPNVRVRLQIKEPKLSSLRYLQQLNFMIDNRRPQLQVQQAIYA